MQEKIPTKNLMVNVVLVLFTVLTVWWLALNPLSVDPNLDHAKYIWGTFYQIIAIWGGILGIIISRSYGGINC